MLHIGRAADNDLVVDAHGVSDYHAKIVIDFHQSCLIDLSHESGRYGNGIRVIKHSLQHGAVVPLGD